MDNHIANLSFRWRKCFALLFRIGIMMMMVRRVAFASDEDQMGVPDAGLLCISDCATCPVICSPPPPKWSYTPISSPPPTHRSHSPPPPSPSSPQPLPQPPPLQMSEPPSRSSSSSSWANPPPPPFKYNNDMPPGQGPPTPGQRYYPYPLYYFYTSGSSFLSCHAFIFLVILFFSVVPFFC